MLADFALHQLVRQEADRGHFGGTGVFADAATGAGIGMHQGHEHGVLGNLPRVDLERDRPALDRAFSMADLATQTLPGQAVLDIDHRQAHARILDVRQPGRQGTGGAGLHAGDVRTHDTSARARLVVRHADGQAAAGRLQLEDVRRAGVQALPAFDADRVEIILGQGAGWAQGIGRGPRLIAQDIVPQQAAGARERSPLRQLDQKFASGVHP